MYDPAALLEDPALVAELRDSLNAGAPVRRIREAKIKLTARCNLRCVFCRIWQLREHDALYTADVTRLLDDLAALDCRKVHFSGGECTLRDDLVPLVAHAVARGMKTSLTTNGTRLTPELAAALLAAGLRTVTVSLDGPEPALHDPLRGVKGAFKRTINGLRHLHKARKALKARANIRLNMVLTRANYHAYPEVLALARDLGVDEVAVFPVDEKSTTENRLLPWQLREYNEAIAPAVAALRAEYGYSTARHLVYPFGDAKPELQQSVDSAYARGYYADHLCHTPWLHALVLWNGDVLPCCMLRGRIPPLGNIRETPFRDIYLGETAEAFRQRFRAQRLPACADCDDFLAENRVLNEALGM